VVKYVLSGYGESKLRDALLTGLRRQRPLVLCGASAYLSTFGASFLLKTQRDLGLQPGSFVAGLSGAVTHPNAIKALQGAGWNIRYDRAAAGTFHPKILLGGQSFASERGFQNVNFGYIGSANITKGGLLSNVEVGYLAEGNEAMQGLSDLFLRIWGQSRVMTTSKLASYEVEFSRRMQQRTARDLVDLGVATEDDLIGRRRIGEAPAIESSASSSVWVGLQSFTGEHTFQVELPSMAGMALSGMLGTSNGTVDITCTDGVTRKMRYAYYADNGMYRINIPNDVPFVSWARINRDGTLLISQDDSGNFIMQILRDNSERAARGKSYALGTWGSTSTRQYGWY